MEPIENLVNGGTLEYFWKTLEFYLNTQIGTPQMKQVKQVKRMLALRVQWA